MGMTVKVYLNEGTDFMSPYNPATARLHLATSFDTAAEPSEGGVKVVLEEVFEELNIDYPAQEWARQYRADRNRSLSVGDVAVVGETAWTVARFGWDRLSTDDFSAGIAAAC